MTPSPWNPRNGKCHVVKMVLGTPAKAPRTRSDRHHLATFSKANQTRNRNSICDLGAHGMTSNLSELQEISYTFQYPLILVINYSRLFLWDILRLGSNWEWILLYLRLKLGNHGRPRVSPTSLTWICEPAWSRWLEIFAPGCFQK